MTKYSVKQLEVHGELILKHIKNPDLRWRYRKSRVSKWQLLGETLEPTFYVQCEYEIVDPMAVSDKGEEIYEGDIVYWFDCVKGEVVSTELTNGMNLEGSKTATRIATTHKEALQLGKEMLVEYFNQQFEPVTDVHQLQENVHTAISNLRNAMPFHEVIVEIRHCHG